MAIEKERLNTMHNKYGIEGTESGRNTPISFPDNNIAPSILKLTSGDIVSDHDSLLPVCHSSRANSLSSITLTSSTPVPVCSIGNIPVSESRHHLAQPNIDSNTSKYSFSENATANATVYESNNSGLNNNICGSTSAISLTNVVSMSAPPTDAIVTTSDNFMRKINSPNSSINNDENDTLLHHYPMVNNVNFQKDSYGEMLCSYVNGTTIHERKENIDNNLGPLPPKWESAYTERGELYFIDHNTGTSHWLDPRLSKFQKKTLEDCSDNELPYGWEKIDDALYGTYYIDHVNRRTQYENPVLEAKRRIIDQKEKCKQLPYLDNQGQNVDNNSCLVLPYKFTKNPAEMLGERITTTLLKSSRGLGITIIGGDDNVEEFLQIKSIVPNGPAWLDGRLQTGDILVFVNDTCVLGFTHHEMVNVFQSILPGETVTFEVCRGYPLPFDPNDPNTEVVTTIAVDGINSNLDKDQILLNLNIDTNFNYAKGRNSLDILPENVRFNEKSRCYMEDKIGNEIGNKPEILTLTIAKGGMGFGFTIADSAHGQKVKKILDRKSCKSLHEGDILLEINNIPVHEMSHCEVVRVLKECPKSESTIVKIQRTANIRSFNNCERKKDQWIKGNDPNITRFFRSKTPTAELYSTQPKEILPVRPKTPLIDTRKSYVKIPSNDVRESIQIEETDIDFGNSDKQHYDMKSTIGNAKSMNSLQEIESINNDIGFIDSYQEIATHLSDRLTIASLNENYNSNNPDLNPYVFSDTIYDGIFAQQENDDAVLIQSNVENGHGFYFPLTNILGTTATQHQETCYCYECQDSRRYRYYQHTQGVLGIHVNQGKIKDSKTGCSPSENRLEEQQQQCNFALPQMWNCSLVGNNNLQNAISNNYKLFEVTLERRSQGFGFRIVGGTEEGSQVTIGHVVPGGAADSNTDIATGDEILSIDGVSVINSSHHKVVSLMGESALRGQVTMILRRQLRQTNSSTTPRTVRYPYDVVLNRNENEGFGFVIISSSNQLYGSTIGKLIPGSPADQCGEIKIGDHIVAVNRVDIAGMTHGNVVNLIKESGLQVRLTIGLPKEDILALTMNSTSQFKGENSTSFEKSHTSQHLPL